MAPTPAQPLLGGGGPDWWCQSAHRDPKGWLSQLPNLSPQTDGKKKKGFVPLKAHTLQWEKRLLEKEVEMVPQSDKSITLRPRPLASAPSTLPPFLLLSK